MMPIPPATVSFHGRANVHPAGSPEVGPLLEELGRCCRRTRDLAAIIEIVPESAFVTYGIGIADPDARSLTAGHASRPR